MSNLLNRKVRSLCALGLAISTGLATSTQAIAQINLRGDRSSANVSPSESSRQNREEFPVSRNVLPAPLPLPTSRGVASSPAGISSISKSSREAEYAGLLQEAEALDRQLGLIRRIARFSGPSIVHIEATKKTETAKGFASSRVEEAGAGIIVDLLGSQYVVTNRHVIYPAELSSIRFELSDGVSLRPTKVWTDPSTDIAVLDLGRNDLVSAKIGDSDLTEIGDFVVAVGSPFGLSHSVSYGIISAKGRRNLELGSKGIEIQDFFQTDAAINPGNSGGPLINSRGEIIGINTAIASNSGGSEGIGFTIPINMAMHVAEQLVSKGSMRRSYLGVQLENAFDSITASKLGLKSTRGALVKSILPNSPAHQAGIKVGDVILELNGRQIENDGHLVKMVGLTPVGSQAELLVYREGSTRRVAAYLEAAPE
jgi:serine protease Do